MVAGLEENQCFGFPGPAITPGAQNAQAGSLPSPAAVAAAPCPICDNPAERQGHPESFSATFRCPSCAVYKVTGEAELEFKADPFSRAAIAGVLRERKIAGASSPAEVVTRASAKALIVHAPRRVGDLIDRTLLNIARSTKRPGEKLHIDMRADKPLAFAATDTELIYVLRSLAGMGYFTSDDVNDVALSPKGWARVEELQGDRAPGETAFVAMSFDPALESVYEKGIRPAIQDAGWTPYHVGKIEHTGKIDEVILLEIQRARLVVADFTMQKQSVYFEAGYALALGKLVIWACRHDESKQLHFDTRQYNHILWEDEADLRKRLADRIKLLAPSPRTA